MSDSPPILYCANHPTVETTLRCNRCEKPICVKCAVLTPTGYRCKECVRGQQKIFDTAIWYDFISASVVSFILSLIGSYIIPFLGFFTIFLAPVAGWIIASAVRFAVRRRRSRRMFQLAAITTAVGALPFLLFDLITGLAFLSQAGLGLLLPVLWKGLYAIIVTTTVYYQLSGIKIS